MTENEVALIEKPAEGKLDTNIDVLEKFVAEKLVEYTPENYKGDSDDAKKDRAMINTSIKEVSTRRIAIVKKALARFCIDVFEDRCKKVEKDMKAVSDSLDAIVKIKEDEEKEIKRAQIEEYWRIKGFDLFGIEKIFDQKWLNKGAKLKDIHAEIDAKIEKVYADIKTIEMFGVDVDTLKPLYLETLDIGRTIEQGTRIKENRERLAKEAAEREERERSAALVKQQVELVKEELAEQKSTPAQTLAQMAGGEPIDDDPEMEFTIRFKGKKSVLFKMRQWMTENSIMYEKL